MAKQYDVLFRLLLLGDSGVGKTCLLCRLTDNEFLSPHISTIGEHWSTGARATCWLASLLPDLLGSKLMNRRTGTETDVNNFCL